MKCQQADSSGVSRVTDSHLEGRACSPQQVISGDGAPKDGTMTERHQPPGITGDDTKDDTKDDDTKGHIVRDGPATTPRATTPIRAHPSQNQPRRGGNRPCQSPSI
jgi:hypothetical protein